jgi:hypothetical protein
VELPILREALGAGEMPAPELHRGRRSEKVPAELDADRNPQIQRRPGREPDRSAAERLRMPEGAEPESASGLIDARIEELADWRGELLSRLRALIRQAEPEVVEEVKWRKPSNPLGVPVWSCDGILCTGETYGDKVKLTFAKGASLDDPAGLFNASLEGRVRRAIDLYEGEEIDEEAFKSLVRAAANLNGAAAGG